MEQGKLTDEQRLYLQAIFTISMKMESGLRICYSEQIRIPERTAHCALTHKKLWVKTDP